MRVLLLRLLFVVHCTALVAVKQAHIETEQWNGRRLFLFRFQLQCILLTYPTNQKEMMCLLENVLTKVDSRVKDRHQTTVQLDHRTRAIFTRVDN